MTALIIENYLGYSITSDIQLNAVAVHIGEAAPR